MKAIASSSGEITTQTNSWVNKTKDKLRHHTQTVIPANHQPLLLPDEQVYQHFVALSKLKKDVQEHYTTGDPTLFQHALSKEQMAQLSLQDYLQKAASVGNLALVQWLVAFERGTQRAIATQATLLAAARSGSLELVEWLMAAERDAQQLNPGQPILSAAARSGNLALVRWLTAPERGTQQLKPSRVTLSFARLSGNWALVKWLKQVMQLQEWKDLFPTTAINKEILSYLPGEDILSFANTTRSADQLVTDSKVLLERIRNEFGRNIQTLIPANRQPLLLSHTRIYRHLTAWRKLDRQTRNRYALDDPALFQRALPADVIELPLLYDYLDKAARVGNLALVQWLVASERMPAERQPLLLPHTHIYRHFTALNKLDRRTRNRYALDDPALFQHTLSADVVELPLLYDYLSKAARVGNLALVQWLMAEERGPQRVNPDIETLRCAAGLGNLALVQWLMAEEREVQRVAPIYGTLTTEAARSGNLALVQWLIAEERAEQRLEPDPEFLAQMMRDGELTATRAIKVWAEQILQLRESAVAAPISTPNTSNPQQPLNLESKAPHSGGDRAQRLQSSESKPFYPALPDSKGIPVLDSKTLSIQQIQTPVASSSSSMSSTTAFSSTVTKTGSPIHREAKQQQAAASSQPKQVDTGSQTGHETSSSNLSSAGSLEDSQSEPPGKQGK